MRKPRLLASSVLAGVAVAAALTTVVAPAANASGNRVTHIFYSGVSSVSGPQCQAEADWELHHGADYATCTYEPSVPGTDLTIVLIRN